MQQVPVSRAMLLMLLSDEDGRGGGAVGPEQMSQQVLVV